MNDSDSEPESSSTSVGSIEIDDDLRTILEADYPQNTNQMSNDDMQAAMQAADFPTFAKNLNSSLNHRSPIESVSREPETSDSF